MPGLGQANGYEKKIDFDLWVSLRRFRWVS